MSALERFERYLDEARSLLRREALARAGAGVAISAALVTLLAVGWLLGRGFPSQQVVLARLLLVVLVVATGAALFLPTWHRLRRDGGARELERRLPGQDGRIDTLLDARRRARAGEPASVLTEFLAQDAERIAARRPLEQVLPATRRLIPASIAITALLALVGLALFGPATWRAGTRHLWLGQSLPAPALAGARSLAVSPGNATVRRNQDLTVRAEIRGLRAGEAKLHVRYGDGEWEAAPMRSTTDGRFDLTLYALREPAEYYVAAGGLTSEHFQLALVDLPKVTALKLRYDYPHWTGLPAREQEEDGAISAVTGTRVTVQVEADAPLDQPLLVVDESSTPLAAQGARGAGELTVKKDGHYRIAAKFGDELVALTEDFPITAVPDEKPSVEVVRPGRDYQASAIEEVPVRLRANDDYRLDAMELRYSVNGGPWQTEKVPAGAREIDTAALLDLEALGQAQPRPAAGPRGLVPGDLITYYAVARDHAQSNQTDLFMVQVQPFDRRYSQGQGGGGGGGGGAGDETGIAERQREILLATYNLNRNPEQPGRDAERRSDNAKMLADLQTTLRDQAKTLVERTRARELATADPDIRRFVESLEQAAKEMDPAASRLAEAQLEAAIPNEQRALQHLLRAESAFREIQVTRQNGGGGGDGGQAGRDVAEMTELELDLEKNQYETESQLAQQNGSNQRQDEALRKLKELARRQEQLARQDARNPQQPEQSRWQQEQLRREAEQLRRQLEELAKQQQARNGQQPGQRGQPEQRGRQGVAGSGEGGASAQAAADAARQLEQALANMRADSRAEPGERSRQREGSAEEASLNLNRAVERLERGRQQAVGESFEGLAREARAILDEQRRTEQELGEAVRGFRARQQQLQQQGGSQRSRTPSDVFGGLDVDSAEKLAARKRDLQARLEALRSKMQAASRANEESAPKAVAGVDEARGELDESQTAARLARSALEIERGRTQQAAARDGIITASLESLERSLSETASVAAGEGSRPGKRSEAGADELLAELANLRRAVEEAQLDAARDGAWNGGGPDRGWRGEEPRNAGGVRDWTAIGAETRASSERLADLRARFGRGRLPDADIEALRELAERLRRAGNDPMSNEYRRMMALVDQLELAALRAGGDSAARITRGNARDDEPARYRENVAEYYRRLGDRQQR